MTRRQTGLWAGVVLGAVLMGCQTTTAPVTTEITSSKSFLSDGMMIGPEGGTRAWQLHVVGAAWGRVRTDISVDHPGEQWRVAGPLRS